MTDERSTLEQVTDILTDALGCPADDVTRDASFNDLGADSMDVVEVVMSTEDVFGIEIPDHECQHLWRDEGHNVGELVDLVDAKLAEKVEA